MSGASIPKRVVARRAGRARRARKRSAAILAAGVAAMIGATVPATARAQAGAPAGDERVRRLEAEVRELKAEVEALRAREAERTAAEEAGEPGSAAEPPPAAGAGESPAPAAPPAPAGSEAAAAGSEAAAGGDADLRELARRLEVLAAEIENLKLGEAAAAEADVAERGLGPAASKVYRTGRGLSIGGYGEALYQNFDSTRDDGARSGATDRSDLLRAVLYAGYKFDDRFLFNSELEFEHGSTGDGGEVSVEFAYLDYLRRPGFNVRAGLVLLPMGLVNELHEPTVFLGARRPDVERVILPTTWRENGLGLFGDAGPWSYRTYVVNGLDAAGFSAAGLRGGKQDGAQAAAEDFAWVGRLDWKGAPGLLVGGSLYHGGSGQGLAGRAGRRLDVATTIAEAHFDGRWRGFQLRALAARAEIDQAAELNRALGLAGAAGVGAALAGGYLEVAYDLGARRGGAGGAAGERSLRPYLRWERFDTQAEVPAGFRRDPARDVESFTLGLAFQPLDEVIVKVDYQDFDNGAGTGVDQFNAAIGYVF